MLALVVSVAETDVDLAADALWSLGVVAIEERRQLGVDEVELWTSLGDDVDAVRAAAATHLTEWSWRVTEVDESVAETWRHFAEPVWIEPDLVVCPAWVAFDAMPGVTVLRIEPGSTFGLGDHPTTVLSMRAIRAAVRPSVTVLDVGCGSGVLAVAAGVFGASHVEAIDIAPAAVPTTRANAAANSVAGVVTVSNTPLAEVDGRFDVVVANILAPTLIDLADDLRRVLADSGVLIISGVLCDHHDHVDTALAPLVVTDLQTDHGWAAVTYRALPQQR